MSTRYVPRSGFCPTQNKDYSVTVEQLETTTMSDKYKQYIDRELTCDYASQHVCPVKGSCPVARINR